ncbi:putative phosphatidate phosphatase [Lycorma delicatula]|uniref:putative phosphatidate phosphatase n=1 Tax=Lycorma delicatula TaxID=130591 RepID=UPI003F51A91D
MAFTDVRRRVLLDVICIIFVGLTLLVFEFIAKPYKRGFFCGDSSIFYPYHESTVSNGLLATVALSIPIIVVVLCEGIRLFESSTPRDSWRTVGMRLAASCYDLGGMYLLGAGLSQLTVNIAKYLVGRLRPHFMAVCIPDVNCSLLLPYVYVTNYTCTGDEHLSTEARLSFPSGHAALSFYAALYTVIYLQKRMLWGGSQVLRHLLQASCIFAAWFTALSRVQDNMHHWDDVLAGIIIGVFWTIFVVKFVVNLDISLGTDDELWALRKPRDNQNPSSV